MEEQLQSLQEEKTPLEISPNAEQPVVLIVEDNRDLRNFIADSLAQNFQCVTANDGQDGYAKACEFKPDLILSDLMMPLFSGKYLVEKLQQNETLKEVPVVILTAKADENLRVELLKAGVQDYILKPFLTEELLARVQNHIHAYRARKVLKENLESTSDNLQHLAEEVAKKNTELQRLNRLKDDFLASLSHELRTPVSIIFGYSELLTNELEEKEGLISEAVDAIHRNATSQLRLVEDLMDISKSISGKIILDPKRTDMSEVLKESIKTIENAAKVKNIRVEVQLDSDLPPVWSDPVRLSQIFWNLLSNAVKFTPEGGHISLEAKRNGPFVELSVSDDGEGIEPGFLPYVFDRFSQQDGTITRKYGGLGLGLSIVKHLVDLHGGKISVHSSGAGKGTRFTVSLPCSRFI